jgi:hypothetical protein
MKKLTAALVFTTMVLGGCTGSITDLNVENKEPSCVRECSNTYSQCIGTGGKTNSKTLGACLDGYEVCTTHCPKGFKP